MDRNNCRGSLPSRVEADGCLESRIPTLGLHMDQGFGKEDVCLSGPVDSGISSIGGAICDSGFETSMDTDLTDRMRQISLKSDQTDEQFTDVHGMCKSVDEGFISSEIPETKLLPDVAEEKVQINKSQEEFLRLFTPDDEGDT